MKQVQKVAPITEEEIDHINEMHGGIRRAAKRILKDAIEIGEFFNTSRHRYNVVPLKHRGTIAIDKSDWKKWLEEKFPKISFSSIYRYMRLASNREMVETLSQTTDNLTMAEALRLIESHNRQPKPRVRTVAVKAEADPLLKLEANLKNYVICLWQLRYLEAETKELIRLAELSDEQVHKILRFVTKDHHEVEEEVMRTFSPYPRIIQELAQ